MSRQPARTPSEPPVAPSAARRRAEATPVPPAARFSSTRLSHTSTSSFGVSGRVSHDASAFYGRFSPPATCADSALAAPVLLDQLVCGDARQLLADPTVVVASSVALVVTSPPYFAGKDYEVDLSDPQVPSSYTEFLGMLRDVLAGCVPVLEPGGRIAVNVANLGRRPYRSLSADVVRILQDDLGLLMRGEVVWRKSLGASSSLAWGTFGSGANPVLRDTTERILVASKGRFDRAVSRAVRAERGLPHADTISADEFMAATLDCWDIPPESASRVGHPAPFPVEVPRRLIELYSFAGDLVLDPFAGSGSAAVAAASTGRHFLGFDLDPEYLATARGRVAAAVAGIPAPGAKARSLAAGMLEAAGFAEVVPAAKLPAGLSSTLTALDREGRRWFVDVLGSLAGRRVPSSEEMFASMGRAAALSDAEPSSGFGVVVASAPSSRSPAWRALAHTDLVDAVAVLDDPSSWDGFAGLSRSAAPL